jgi:hypothetical protein
LPIKVDFIIRLEEDGCWQQPSQNYKILEPCEKEKEKLRLLQEER